MNMKVCYPEELLLIFSVSFLLLCLVQTLFELIDGGGDVEDPVRLVEQQGVEDLLPSPSGQQQLPVPKVGKHNR